MEAVKDMDKMMSEILDDPTKFGLPSDLESKSDDEINELLKTIAMPKEEVEEKDEEEIVVKVKPSLLGSYLKGKHKERKPEEAIEAMLKGKLEADKTIEALKAEREEIKGKYGEVAAQTEKLQKELEEWKKSQKPADKQEAAKIEIPELPDIPENLDLFDEAQQRQFLANMKAYTTTVKELHKKLASGAVLGDVKKKIETLEEKVTDVVADTSKKKDLDFRQSQIDAEYDRIRKFQKTHPELKTDNDIQKIEKDYQECMRELASAAGIEGDIVEDGVYKQEVLNLMEKFRSGDEEVTELASEKEIDLPEETDKLFEIYKLRAKAEEFNSQIYKDPLSRYEKAYEYWALERGLEEKAALDKKMQRAEKVEKAKANLKTSVRTARQSDSEDMSLSYDKFMEVFNIDSSLWTDANIASMRTYLKSIGEDPGAYHHKLKG